MRPRFAIRAQLCSGRRTQYDESTPQWGGLYSCSKSDSSRLEATEWFNTFLLQLTFPVLYSSKYQTWKITDFGSTEEGASKKALQTQYAKGINCYRAPELLRGSPVCTNKVDIWAIGCILFEVISGRKAFEGDRKFKHFDSSAVGLEPLLPYRLRSTLCKVVTDLINAILVHDPRQRPTAREINDEILRNVFGAKMGDDRRNEIQQFRLCTRASQPASICSTAVLALITI